MLLLVYIKFRYMALFGLFSKKKKRGIVGLPTFFLTYEIYKSFKRPDLQELKS